METKSKEDKRFTVEERRVLASLPWIVGAAVSEVDKGGAQHADAAETRAMNSAVEAGIAAFSSSTMIDLVIEHHRMTWAAAKAEVATKCQQALTLIASKATDEEVDAYKRLVMDVAYAVATASGSGYAGLGKKISSSESEMIDRIALAMLATQHKRK